MAEERENMSSVDYDQTKCTVFQQKLKVNLNYLKKAC